MPNPVHWEWSIGPSVRAYLAAALMDDRNLRLNLPSDPNCPMRAVVSSRIVGMVRALPEPIHIDSFRLQRVALRAFEGLLGVYCGADLDGTLLIEAVDLKFLDGDRGAVCLSAVLLWDSGTLGAFARDEIELDEDYWVDRQLFLTELKHRAETLDE